MSMVTPLVAGAGVVVALVGAAVVVAEDGANVVVGAVVLLNTFVISVCSVAISDPNPLYSTHN